MKAKYAQDFMYQRAGNAGTRLGAGRNSGDGGSRRCHLLITVRARVEPKKWKRLISTWEMRWPQIGCAIGRSYVSMRNNYDLCVHSINSQRSLSGAS